MEKKFEEMQSERDLYRDQANNFRTEYLKSSKKASELQEVLKSAKENQKEIKDSFREAEEKLKKAKDDAVRSAKRSELLNKNLSESRQKLIEAEKNLTDIRAQLATCTDRRITAETLTIASRRRAEEAVKRAEKLERDSVPVSISKSHSLEEEMSKLSQRLTALGSEAARWKSKYKLAETKVSKLEIKLHEADDEKSKIKNHLKQQKLISQQCSSRILQLQEKCCQLVKTEGENKLEFNSLRNHMDQILELKLMSLVDENISLSVDLHKCTEENRSLENIFSTYESFLEDSGNFLKIISRLFTSTIEKYDERHQKLKDQLKVNEYLENLTKLQSSRNDIQDGTRNYELHNSTYELTKNTPHSSKSINQSAFVEANSGTAEMTELYAQLFVSEKQILNLQELLDEKSREVEQLQIIVAQRTKLVEMRAYELSGLRTAVDIKIEKMQEKMDRAHVELEEAHRKLSEISSNDKKMKAEKYCSSGAECAR